MPQIRLPFLFMAALLSLTLFILSGCGDKNPQSNFDVTSEKNPHPAGWLPLGHSIAAKAQIESCTECHGADFSGGIAKVKCTQCHLGDEENVHPLDWKANIFAGHKAYVAQNGTAGCSATYCHGANLTGVTGSGPSCTSCHLGGPLSVHPANWFEADKKINPLHGSADAAKCQNLACHGANGAGVTNSGPACTSCHIVHVNPKTTPIPKTAPCVSCHYAP